MKCLLSDFSPTQELVAELNRMMEEKEKRLQQQQTSVRRVKPPESADNFRQFKTKKIRMAAICQFHQHGHCKFAAKCEKIHTSVTRDSFPCQDSDCLKRHPRMCKYYAM